LALAFGATASSVAVCCRVEALGPLEASGVAARDRGTGVS
jgi:hypothetical protein